MDGNTVQQYAHVSSLCGFGGGSEVKLDGPNWWVSERSEEGTHMSDQFDRQGDLVKVSNTKESTRSRDRTRTVQHQCCRHQLITSKSDLGL